MKKKFLSLALTLALCLGLTVPAFAETMTETIGGITITVNSNGTINYTGSGTFTGEHAEYGIKLLNQVTDAINAVTVSIGPGIAIDDDIIYGMNLLEYMEKMLQDDIGAKSVTINANSESALQTVGGFTDVKKSDYFADPVVWAVDKKITAGTSSSTFSPNQNCTVAQIVSFLWRAYGSPKSSKSNPFSDVKSGDYYYSAALWAAEKGMVTGGTFGGDRPCTRSMAVNYMWKADTASGFEIKDGVLIGYSGNGVDVVIPDGVTELGFWAFYQCANLRSLAIPASVEEIGGIVFESCPNITDVYYGGSEAQWKNFGDFMFDNNTTPTIHYNSKMPEQKPVNTGFTDVPGTADYAQAVKWAVDNEVTSGTSATAFSPDSVCTRGQIVTFLHRALAK